MFVTPTKLALKIIFLFYVSYNGSTTPSKFGFGLTFDTFGLIW